MSKLAGNGWLIGAGLLFGLYSANVVVGKFAPAGGELASYTINDVGEFLTLFAAVVCLVVSMLIKESHQSNAN